ncbi:TraB/GumN family protein [Planktotalea sp.]|uniref:TraB/GumN family protein n=1 Tax=Planktotalea sp. TaxID=2029877 RepID=UPI003D6B0EA1
MQIDQYIKAFLTGLFCAFSGAASASGACEGTDLRTSMPAAQLEKAQKRAADAPFAEGNHWRAIRGGKVIHIIGTIHLSDPRLTPITERLAGVIETSDLLLLEAGPKEEAALKTELATRPELMFLDGATLPELLVEDDWARLADAMKQRGIPPVLGSRFQPWYLSVMLGMPPCLLTQMQNGGAEGLDHRLKNVALDADVEVRGLEPHDTLFQIFNDDPLEQQIELMLLGLETADQSLDALETVVAAYFDQQALLAWEISRSVALQIEGESPDRLGYLFDRMEANLLTKRNLAWMPVMLEALKTRTQISVAVGAGHLGGEQGVLSLLETMGFKLERLPL